jgi:hypothetical protein
MTCKTTLARVVLLADRAHPDQGDLHGRQNDSTAVPIRRPSTLAPRNRRAGNPSRPIELDDRQSRHAPRFSGRHRPGDRAQKLGLPLVNREAVTPAEAIRTWSSGIFAGHPLRRLRVRSAGEAWRSKRYILRDLASASRIVAKESLHVGEPADPLAAASRAYQLASS